MIKPLHKRSLTRPFAQALLAASLLTTAPVLADTTPPTSRIAPRAMLVLDGSNSMWGQIEGTTKITIARDVVRTLLEDLPPELALGLIAYGHRRSGDCHDVEVLVDPAQHNRSSISQEIGAIRPTGKTPMAEAVRQAAQALGNTDAPATVILVSDGVETCAEDVCAVATELERSGVDFTAHVIGFDVKEEEADNQFACITKATGGRYLSVDTAEELSAALIATTQFQPTLYQAPQLQAPQFQAPQFQTTETGLPLITRSGHLRFVASHKMRGKLLNLPVHWQIEDQNGTPIMTGFHNAGGQIDLKPGNYRLTATDTERGRSQTRRIRVTDGGSMQITLMFP